MTHKDFDLARAERQREWDPVTFTLAGQEFAGRPAIPIGDIWTGGVKHPERFSTDVPMGRVFLQFAETLALWLPESDRERFWAIFDEPKHDVIGQDLVDIVEWLTEEYTGRPTSPSAASPNGSLTDGSTSNSTSRPSDSATSFT